jgi:hypothetical protein
MIVKDHTTPIQLFKDILFDHVITCIRKPTDIFMSAYIKDFKTIAGYYPYEYAKEPIIDNIDDMVDHFTSFDWGSFDWCSYDYNFKQLEQLTGLNIWKLPFNRETGVSHYPGTPSLTVVTHQTLFDDNRYLEFRRICETHLNLHETGRDGFRYRNVDTYGDLYQQFKDRIPQSFFDRYKELDYKIMSKFFDN